MKDELTEDDIERIRTHYPINFKEHLARVRRLLRAAQPGNVPFQILEAEYGFIGDYSPSDAGEPPYEQ